MSAAPAVQPLAADPPSAVVVRALSEARRALGMDVAWLGHFVGGSLVLRALDGDAAGFGMQVGDVLPVRTWAGTRIGVPVHRPDGELLGSLGCASHGDAPRPDEHGGRLLRALAGVVASQLEHEASADTGEATARDAAEARRESRAKSEFLSRMSHELRTPLNAILGFGQLLELDALNEEQRDSVGHILKGGAHLLELVNEALDISRIEAGALRLTLEAVELAEAVRSVVSLLSPLAVERGVTIRVDAGPDGTAWGLADVGRIRQVVLNLISNAVKYNRPGGMVTVRIRRAGDDGVRLVVSDTGPGLAPEDLDRVFSPFERLAADGATEGTGLGLTLSRSLAEAMAGTLTASSEPGCGADFTLRLQAADEPAVTPGGSGARPDRPAGGAAGRRVLCVEDNPSNLRLVERALSRAGVEVLGAPQGGLGIELARRHGPDLVLLDLDLPDGPGETVLAALAGDPATARIPVVVCSADASPATIERLRAGGARDFLTKPLDVAHLLKTVAALTDGGHG